MYDVVAMRIGVIRFDGASVVLCCVCCVCVVCVGVYARGLLCCIYQLSVFRPCRCGVLLVYDMLCDVCVVVVMCVVCVLLCVLVMCLYHILVCGVLC